jgi:NitT/TauT family transport system substrate-binding protein
MAAVTGSIWIVGIVKQSPTAIVAREGMQVGSLLGKRVAYVEASSAHQTLLQGLTSAGLKEKDIHLVTMRVDDMPAALERGDIDAFAAWEPAPSIALANSGFNRIVFRGSSTDYFVIGKGIASRSPQAVEALVAGYLRAIDWLRLSQKNLEQAAAWVTVDAEAFSGKKSEVKVAQIAGITRRELLNVPSAPLILVNPKAPPPLKGEFNFLKGLGKLPSNATWETVEAARNNDLLLRILADMRHYEVNRFDYRE